MDMKHVTEVRWQGKVQLVTQTPVVRTINYGLITNIDC